MYSFIKIKRQTVCFPHTLGYVGTPGPERPPGASPSERLPDARFVAQWAPPHMMVTVKIGTEFTYPTPLQSPDYKRDRVEMLGGDEGWSDGGSYQDACTSI